MIVDGGLPSVPVGPADRSARPSALVGTPGTLHGPGNKASGVTDGIGTPPPSSQEDHAQADRTAGATIPRLPSSTGGGAAASSSPAPRLPRGYSTRFCVTGCNARGRVHINGECVVCRDFGGDR